MNDLISVLRKALNIYYIENVNINYSFASLKNLCLQNKIDISKGDILVVDNEKKDKRKVLIVNNNGAIIIYGSLLRGNMFVPFNKSIKLNNILTPKKDEL